MRADVRIRGGVSRTGAAPGVPDFPHPSPTPGEPANRRGALLRMAAWLVLLVLATFAVLPSASAQSHLAPQNLHVAGGDRFVTLTWETPQSSMGASPVTHYRYRFEALNPHEHVSVSRTDNTRWVDIAGGGSQRMVKVTSLRNDARYRFQVVAVNRHGHSFEATEYGSPIGVPKAVTELRATPGDRSIEFFWAPPDVSRTGDLPILRYEYRFVPGKDRCRGDWAMNALDTSVTLTETNDQQPLMNGREYCFSVVGYNLDGYGDDHRGINATPVGAPLQPSSLTAMPGDSVATLTWKAPTDIEGVSTGNGGTDILRYEYREFRRDDTGIWIGIGPVPKVVVPNLTNGRRYGFEVRAVNAQGAGPAAPVRVLPLGRPSRPRELAATPGDKQVTLRWQQPANNGGSAILHYEYRRDGLPWVSTDLVREATVQSLTNGQRYRFEVRAVNARGDGDAEEVTATPVGPPSAPVSPSAEAGDGHVTLTWEPPLKDGGAAIVRYEYCVGATADCEKESGTWISAGQNLRASVTGLENGKSHNFNVRAVNAVSEGALAMTGAMPIGPPSAPVGLAAEEGNGEVKLTWMPPESNGGSDILQYEYRRDGSGWKRVGGEDAQEKTEAGLTNGRSYGFEVRAVNAADPGEAATVTATPSETPSKPSDLIATRGNGQVMLAWEKPSGNGGSRILHYEYCFGEIAIATATAQKCVGEDDEWISTRQVREAVVMDLINGRLYEFNVRAVNMQGEGAVATETATPSERPPAPLGLMAAPGNEKVTLSWDGPSTSTVGSSPIVRYEYEVDRSRTWVRVSGGPAARSATVPDLENNRSYEFKVRAVNGQGPGEAAPVTATPVGPQGAPVNLTARAGNREVELNWEPPESNGGLTIQRYEFRRDGGAGWISAGTARQVTVSSLVNGREYIFEVRAVNMQDVVGAVATVMATPSATPSAPHNLSATPGDAEVTLRWEPPSSTGGSDILRYEYRVDGGVWTRVGGARAREKRVEELENGRSYDFEVRAVNAADPGEAATVTETPSATPSAPHNLSATPGDAEVTLNWEPPQSTGGSAIEHYEYRVDGSGWTQVGEGADARSTTVMGLTNGQSYDFEVRAENMQGKGAEAKVMATLSGKPTEPLNLSATPGDRQVTLSWDVPLSDGGSAIERYEYQVDRSENWIDTGRDRRVPVMGLTNGQSYDFEVRAVNVQGAGAVAMETATPSATPTAPHNLSATPGDRQVTLNWEPPQSTGGSAIERYEYRVDGRGVWTRIEVEGVDKARGKR